MDIQNNGAEKTVDTQNFSFYKLLSFTADKVGELADANSVLGEKIEAEGFTIIPVSKMSVGFAGGGADITDAVKKKKQKPAGSGGKVTLTPMAFLVVDKTGARIINLTGETKPSTAAEIVNAVITQVKELIENSKNKNK